MAFSFFPLRVRFQTEEGICRHKKKFEAHSTRSYTASAKGDFAPFVTALDDDLESLDHIPYRFDNKNSFLAFIQRGWRARSLLPSLSIKVSCRPLPIRAAW